MCQEDKKAPDKQKSEEKDNQKQEKETKDFLEQFRIECYRKCGQWLW